MIEAFYHINSIPDLEYVNRTVDIDLIKNSEREYKTLVSREQCLKKNSIKKDQYIEIIKENYNMAKAKWTESCLSPIQDDSIILADKLDYCGNSLIEKTQS